MSRKIRIERDAYIEKEYIYKKKSVTLEPGVTVLVGCNGSGKTTFLHMVKDTLRENKIKFIDFDNLISGGHNARSKALFYGNIAFTATAMCSSEGENIIMNMRNVIGDIGRYVRSHVDQNEYWILLDAVDSGLSIDNIVDIKSAFNLIVDDITKQGKEVYIIVSANEYEMCRNMRCFDVYEGKYRQFRTYDSYYKFIMKSKEIKDLRYRSQDQ